MISCSKKTFQAHRKNSREGNYAPVNTVVPRETLLPRKELIPKELMYKGKSVKHEIRKEVIGTRAWNDAFASTTVSRKGRTRTSPSTSESNLVRKERNV